MAGGSRGPIHRVAKGRVVWHTACTASGRKSTEGGECLGRRDTERTTTVFPGRTWQRVRRIFGRVIAFAKWLFTSEQLPAPSGGSVEPGRRDRRFEYWLLGKERLAEESGATVRRARRRSFFMWVFAPDQLQTVDRDPVRPPEKRRSLLSWLLSKEQLPPAAVSDNRERARRGVLRSLLSAETLTRQPGTTSARPRGFVSWLLSGETL
jgi:hypothetical protein